MPLRRSLVMLLLVVCALAPARAGGPLDATGELAFALMLRKLATVGTIMHATAHPDDENNGLLAMQSHGQGFRVVLATATRGNGGQNEIGPELFEALGVLRTEELLAAHRYDGAEQFFARAVDFGYSFSIEESYDKWGKDEIVGDYVRLIRMTRPDVVLTMRPDGAGGGQHHQASARLALEAFKAAGDPTKYPEQLKEGLEPWQPKKIYQTAQYGFSGEQSATANTGTVAVDTSVYDSLLGSTYFEIGAEGRSMHKCQGMGQLLPLPGTNFVTRYRLVGTSLPGGTERNEQTLTDGLDLSLAGLLAYAGSTPPAPLAKGIGEIGGYIKAADADLHAKGMEAAASDVARGLIATRAVRKFLETSGLDRRSRYELDFRLAQTEDKFVRALVLAHALRFEALADDGVVVPGQPVKVTLIAANRAATPLEVRTVALDGFEGSSAPCTTGPVAGNGIFRCEAQVTIPADARTTEPYWHRAGEAGRYTFDPDAPFGLPFRPTPFVARFTLAMDGVDVPVAVPVLYRYEGNIFSGEKRMELHVVPKVTLSVSPEILIVPAAAAPHDTSARHAPLMKLASSPQSGDPAGPERNDSRMVKVTLTNNTKDALDTDVRLEAPAGWRITPATTTVHFARGGEADTVLFSVSPPASPAQGEFVLRATAGPNGEYTRGVQVIEYPHTHRRHIFNAAETRVKVIDVQLPPHMTIGYVMGVGDQVPPALEQLGASVVMLDPGTLAGGDLSSFDAIVTGVRAYERRADLRAYNHRMLEYVERGGTLIVQYNKFEFNRAQYGPYPAKVSSARVTDEHAPVKELDESHPVFNAPNRIGPAAWDNWVQERGLYFLGEKDARYRDLVETEDPFPLNAGPKRGALVEAKYGKGRWVYVGLGLWRQLPAGTVGAYQLLANLVSLGRTEGQAGAR